MRELLCQHNPIHKGSIWGNVHLEFVSSTRFQNLDLFCGFLRVAFSVYMTQHRMIMMIKEWFVEKSGYYPRICQEGMNNTTKEFSLGSRMQIHSVTATSACSVKQGPFPGSHERKESFLVSWAPWKLAVTVTGIITGRTEQKPFLSYTWCRK
jgi:hypothetical protein